MDVMGILHKVAEKYGLAPEQLEAGKFTKGQYDVLIRLFRQSLNSQRDEDWERYLEQKAKYLTK